QERNLARQDERVRDARTKTQDRDCEGSGQSRRERSWERRPSPLVELLRISRMAMNIPAAASHSTRPTNIRITSGISIAIPIAIPLKKGSIAESLVNRG